MGCVWVFNYLFMFGGRLLRGGGWGGMRGSIYIYIERDDEGSKVLFNDALNTFYSRLYGKGLSI